MIGEILEATMTAIGIAFITGIVLLIAGLIVLVHKTIMKDE
jgi:membrane-bound ClpP family serine protease